MKNYLLLLPFSLLSLSTFYFLVVCAPEVLLIIAAGLIFYYFLFLFVEGLANIRRRK